MSSDTPVIVKALLPGEKKIVKKFQLPEPVAISLLTDVISKDLTYLDGCKLIITFRDDEDDEVILLTDEDLKTALTEFTANSKQDSFRVSVNVQEDALGHRGCPTCRLVRDSELYTSNDANDEMGTFDGDPTEKQEEVECEALKNNLHPTETCDVLDDVLKGKAHRELKRLNRERGEPGAERPKQQKQKGKQLPREKGAKKLQKRAENKQKKTEVGQNDPERKENNNKAGENNRDKKENKKKGEKNFDGKEKKNKVEKNLEREERNNNKANKKSPGKIEENKATKTIVVSKNDLVKEMKQISGAKSRKERVNETKEAKRKRWVETASNQKQYLQSLAEKQKERMDGLSSRLKSKLDTVREAQENRMANLMAQQIINLQDVLKKQRVHMNNVATKLKIKANEENMQKQAKVLTRVRDRNAKQIDAMLDKQQRYRENIIRKQQQKLERVLQISIRQLMTAAQRFQERMNFTSERQKSYWNKMAAQDRKLMRKQKRALNCLQRKHGSFLRKTAIKKQTSLFKVRALHLQITAKQTTKHANVSRKLIGKQDSSMNKVQVMALNSQTPQVETPNECKGTKPVLSEEEKIEKLRNRFLVKLNDKNKEKLERKARCVQSCEEKEKLNKNVLQEIQEDNHIKDGDCRESKVLQEDKYIIDGLKKSPPNGDPFTDLETSTH